LSNKLISGTHQAFTAIPIAKDASSWRRANPIPSDAIVLTKLLGALQDGCVINLDHSKRLPIIWQSVGYIRREAHFGVKRDLIAIEKPLNLPLRI